MLKMLHFGTHCSQEEDVAHDIGFVVRAQVERSIQCYPMATIPSLFTLKLMNAMYAELLKQLQNMMWEYLENQTYALYQGP
jgi:hypothetical protein